MEKTMQDMSTGNQPDGSTYEITGSILGVRSSPWTREAAGATPVYPTSTNRVDGRVKVPLPRKSTTALIT